MDRKTVIIDESEARQRLDKCLAAHLPEFSRSRLQQLIAEGQLKKGDATITDASYKVKPAEVFTLTIPLPLAMELVASSVELSIVYEDDCLLVIDKPAGMTVHPAPGHRDDTLVNALLAHCGDSLSGIGGVMRPGIVHRIDKDTSGLLVVAKNDMAHKHLSAQLAARTLKREYLAVVKGVPRPFKGNIEGAIGRSPKNRQKMAVVKGGKDALTHYEVKEALGDFALVSCRLESGRTHQIRVHMSHIGHSLVGDAVYGRKLTGKTLPELVKDFPRQALHAERLTLIHPKTLETMYFSAPLPQDIKQLIQSLRGA